MRTTPAEVAATVALVVGACGTKDAPGPLDPTSGQGRIRFVNLITDPTRNPVNAILENVAFGVNLGYAATTPASLPSPSTANFAPIYEGARTLVLKKTADTSVVVATPDDVSTSLHETRAKPEGAGGATSPRSEKRSSRRMIRRAAPEALRKVTLRKSIDVDRVVADPDLLRRTITNLIENAIRYAPPESAVTISAAVRWRFR